MQQKQANSRLKLNLNACRQCDRQRKLPSWFYSEKHPDHSDAIKNMAYKQLVGPVLEYACAAWDSASNTPQSAGSNPEKSSSAYLWHQTNRQEN